MDSGSRRSLERDSISLVRSWVNPRQEDKWLTCACQDPGNGQQWATCTDMAAEDVEDAVDSAYSAFKKYRTVTPRTRADLLAKWDALIREHKDDLATILVHETGKPFAEAQGEVEYAASFTRWFAGEAERIQGTNFAASTPGRRIFTVKQPVGVAVALVPWNFPIAYVASYSVRAIGKD